MIQIEKIHLLRQMMEKMLFFQVTSLPQLAPTGMTSGVLPIQYQCQCYGGSSSKTWLLLMFQNIPEAPKNDNGFWKYQWGCNPQRGDVIILVEPTMQHYACTWWSKIHRLLTWLKLCWWCVNPFCRSECNPKVCSLALDKKGTGKSWHFARHPALGNSSDCISSTRMHFAETYPQWKWDALTLWNFLITTLSILKNFSSINQSILFKEGNKLRTISVMKNILAEATVTEEFSKGLWYLWPEPVS